MKTLHLFMSNLKASALLLLASAMTCGLASCDSDIDDMDRPNKEASAEEAPVEKPHSLALGQYDDLSFLLGTIAETDATGQVTNRYYGVPLNEADPTHLFIGMDELQEARDMFELWLAPDVTPTEHADGSLTVKLTDKEGRAQGTVTFKPATEENHVAEVTTDAPQQIFSRISFIKNEAWPSGKLRAHQFRYYKFDIVEDVTMSDISSTLAKADRLLNFVCIQGSCNGVKPFFCTITKETYWNPIKDEWNPNSGIRNSKYCPALSTASTIQKILLKDWSIFTEVFKEAGCGPLVAGTEYWIDDTHKVWPFNYNEVMDYHSGYTYGEDHYVSYRFLLKMNNLDDFDIYDGMSF